MDSDCQYDFFAVYDSREGLTGKRVFIAHRDQ